MLSPAVTRRLIGHVTDGEAGRPHAPAPASSSTASPTASARSPSRSGTGKSNAEISRELYMSVATVKAHVSRVLEKLGLNNRVQIALLAHDAGEA